MMKKFKVEGLKFKVTLTAVLVLLGCFMARAQFSGTTATPQRNNATGEVRWIFGATGSTTTFNPYLTFLSLTGENSPLITGIGNGYKLTNGTLTNQIEAIQLRALTRNGIRFFGTNGTEIASFNDANGGADNPNILFYRPVRLLSSPGSVYGTSSVLLRDDTYGDVVKKPLADFALATDLTGYVPLTAVGSANGVAGLDGSGKVPYSQLPSNIMQYKGTWNPTTNMPTLANGTGTTGWVYEASVDGSHDFGAGSIAFKQGDFIIYNGSIWEYSGGTDRVTSVNGQQGIVSLNSDNVAEGSTNKYWTSTRTDALYPLLLGSYANPAWITSLAQSKITYTSTTSQYVRGDGSFSTFATDVQTVGDARYGQLSSANAWSATNRFSALQLGVSSGSNLIDAFSANTKMSLTTADPTATSQIQFGRSYGTPGAQTVPSAAVPIGTFQFLTYTAASTYSKSAEIRAEMNSTPSSTNADGKIIFATTPTGSLTTTDRLAITAAGNLNVYNSAVFGSNSAAPSANVDVYNGAGFSIIAGAATDNTRSNSTNKMMRIGMPVYNNAQNPVTVFFGNNTSTDNILGFGGGTGQGQAATQINFYAASALNTATGTVMGNIRSTGWRIGDGSAAGAMVDVVGNIRTYHMVGGTSAPTIAAGAGAGTSPTVSISGTDLSGTITVTTGTTPTAGSVIATVTFNSAYAAAPVVVISRKSITAPTDISIVDPTTTTTFQLTGTLAASTTYKYHYIVIQ